MSGKGWIIILFTSSILQACSYQKPKEKWTSLIKIRISKTEEEWKKQLTPQQFYVLREKGTERTFSGQYLNNHDSGIYVCAACQFPLFSSKAKFESNSGWPSFYQAVSDTVIIIVGADMSNGMIRDEVVCSHCGGHLGHVFPDGPKPTGLRYCMNSASLKFEKKN